VQLLLDAKANVEASAQVGAGLRDAERLMVE